MSSTRLGPILAVHTSVRGRARLRLATLTRIPDLKPVLESALAGRDGIRNAAANPVTGSLLISFNPDRDVGEIIGVVELVAQSIDLDSIRRQHPKPAAKSEASDLTSGVLGFLGHLSRSLRSRRTEPARSMVAMESMPQPWHVAGVTEVSRFWRTDLEAGLTASEAKDRFRKYGPNMLPGPQLRSPLGVFAEQFRGLPVVLLVGAATVSVLTGGIGDAVVIGAVVLLNATIGAAMEIQSERTILSLIDTSEPITTAIRDGEPQQIPGEHVVPGDVVLVTPGTQVPADARLFEAENLNVDESALTGESVPAQKSVAPLTEAHVPLGARTNMVYRGTVVTGGSGSAVVVATGRHTEIGGVQKLITESARPETGMERQMRLMGRQLVWVTGGVAASVFAIGLLRGYSVLEMLKSAISLAVAAVPEGLPTVATVSLAGGVRALTRRGVLIRHLAAVESLGAVEIVCFDKTGTLTLNQMSVIAAFAGKARFEVRGGTFFQNGRRVRLASHPELMRLLEICSLCSEAELVERNGGLVLEGSATEVALLRMAQNSGIDVAKLRSHHPRFQMQHRSSGRNYMTTLHGRSRGPRLIAVKGTPSEVLELSDSYAVDGAVQPITERERRAILSENERMASAALRVLGVAYADGEVAELQTMPRLTWLGLIGIADPPREGVKDLIETFRHAGVRPVMVTGDQRATAHAIGQALGLNGNSGGVEVVDAEDFDHINSSNIGRVDVFSRVSPEQKLRVVRALQHGNRIVAMTGDGINDGPALKAADVGIALGQSGARVAREVADVLLTDDNIQAIVPAIREGRRVRINLLKAIHYIGSTNLSEVLTMVVALAAGLGQPFNTRQLLWINLITDIFPELALTLAPAGAGIMRQPPAGGNAPVASLSDLKELGGQSAIMAGSALSAYAWAVSRYGIGPQASTVAFLTLTSAQPLHAFTMRSRGVANQWLSTSVWASFGALGMSQVGLSALLGTARVSFGGALACCTASLASFLMNELLARRNRDAISTVAHREPEIRTMYGHSE